MLVSQRAVVGTYGWVYHPTYISSLPSTSCYMLLTLTLKMIMMMMMIMMMIMMMM